MRVSIKEKLQGHPRAKVWTLAALAILVILAVLLPSLLLTQDKPQRTEQYKEITGSAGLNAVISYDCASSCDHKFDFNVYIFTESGQQVSVVRPDKDGKVNAALPEGNYRMLIGKQFGKDKLFPQEPLKLKNGQALELTLHYR